jgi:hypothetical protein
MILWLLPALCWAQEFQFRQEFDTIPVEINGWRPFAPWVGGFSKSAPATCDINSDDVMDIFVGNYFGYISYFRGIDTLGSYRLEFVTSFFDSISLFGLPWNGSSTPCFGDLNGDGLLDLIVGDQNGHVHYYRNSGTAQNPNLELITDTLVPIGPPWCGAPELVDIDADGDLDLFGGWQNLTFYRNIGTAQNYNFVLDSSNFAGVSVSGGASPDFVDIDGDGDKDLFVGDENGRLYFYRNDGTAQQYNFTFVTNNYAGINVGGYASPEFADLDGDGDYDLLVGRECPGLSNSPGDIFFYQNVGSPTNAQWQLITKNYLSLDVGYTARHATTDIDGDLDHDLFLVNSGSFISYYQNVGNTDSAAFHWVTDTYQNIYVPFGMPFFSDINGDGAPDLFIGEAVIPNPPYPHLYLYENHGTPRNAIFTTSTSLVQGNYDVVIKPALADIDGDEDKDLFFTTEGGFYYYFKNVGTPTWAQFVYQTNYWQGLTLPASAWYSCFWDIDNDGDLDLFLSNGISLRFYRNTGTPQNAQMTFVTENFLGEDHLPFESVDIFDVDADGDGDFFLTTGNAGMVFYRNITGESPVHPDPKRPAPSYPRITILPNPGNSSLVARYSLPVAGPVSLKVYDIAGRLTGTLFYGFQLPGTYSFSWDAAKKAAGVYMLRLEAGEKVEVAKAVVVK